MVLVSGDGSGYMVPIKFLSLFSSAGQLGFTHRTGGIISYQNLNRHTDKRQVIFCKPFSGRWLKIAFEGKGACGVLGCLSSFPAVLCEELTVITLQHGNGVLGAVLRVWIGFSNEAETARGGLLGGRGGDHLPFLLWPFLPFLQQLSAGKLWFHTRLFQC